MYVYIKTLSGLIIVSYEPSHYKFVPYYIKSLMSKAIFKKHVKASN